MAKKQSTDDVVSFLKEAIRYGRLVSGQRLVEVDITSATGSSRAKVRSAFQSLAVEGLVTIEPNRGASVRKITPAEIVQLYRVREVLEGLAARTVAESAEASGLQKIKALQRQMDRSVEKLNFSGFAELNEQWHAEIFHQSGNGYLLSFRDRMMIPNFHSLSRLLNRHEVVMIANEDHQKITAAIVAGDGANAERLMRRHVGEARKHLERDASGELPSRS